MFLVVMLTGTAMWGQLTLPAGTSYTQDFDGIGSGLPTGWTVRTGATSGARGSVATLTTATTVWSSTSGNFRNAASSEGLTSSSDATAQAASSDRALAVRMSGSFGDPGAAFELQLANTTGKTGFSIQLKHQMLEVQPRTNSWLVQYSTNGTAWTTAGTYTDPGTFGSTTGNYSLGSAIDNIAGNVYIRVVTLASAGSGNRDTYGIDDFSLTWSNGTTPTITLSGSTLTGFTYVAGSGPSAEQSFTVSGTNLTNNISVAATTNYEISTGTGGSFVSQPTITLTQSGGTVSTTTIYTRLKAGLSAGNYNSEVVNVTSTGATSKTMTLSGSVTAPVISAALGGTLGEVALTAGTATATVTLTNDTYAASLSTAGFTLNNAPSGLTLSSVDRTSSTVATLHFAYTGDIDSNVTNFNVTVATSQLTTSGSALTTGNLTITAVNETLSTTPTSVTGLNYILGAGPSTAQSFTVGSGNNLQAGGGTLTIAAPSNFEVSTTSATTGFGTSATLAYTGTGTISPNTAWVRLKSGLSVGTYTQNVTVSGGKATVTMSATGNVTAPPPANDDCTGATALTLNAAYVQGTLENATQSIAAITCGATGNADDDVWYSFTTTGAGDYTITADGGADIDLVLDLRSGACTGTNIACADDTAGNIETITQALSASTTYYVRLYDYDAKNTLTSFTFNIKVSKSLSAPVATAATDVTTNSFTANWNSESDATSYRLDVYTTTTEAATATEGFSGGTTAPDGYTFTGIGSTYTSTGNYGAASPSIGFDATNDRVETPTLSGPATSLSFWIKGQGTNATSALLVEGYNGSSWVTIQNITSIPTTAATRTYTSASSPALPSNIVKFRFTYTKSSGNLSFDDLVIDYQASVPVYVTNYNSKTVTATSDAVTGLTAGTNYHYRVRSVNGAVTSSNSNVINVTTGVVNTWNGTAWSAGTVPTLADNAVIAGDYTTATNGAFSANMLTVQSDTLRVSPNTLLTIRRGITLQNSGGLVVMSNGNLIQIDETATNTGTFTVFRDSNPLQRFDYKIWSSPVSGQVMNVFSPLTDSSRFYQYVTDSNNYQAISGGSQFAFGKGYLIRMPWNHPTAPAVWSGKYEGGLNTGEHSVTLDLNDTTPADSYNAVGNPYASPINADDFIDANSSNIEGTLWFWRKTNGSATDTYATYNRVLGGNSTTAGVATPNGHIQVGQGFIVNATGTSLTFNNAMRESNFANQFFRNGNQGGSAPERHRIWVNLTNADGAFSQALVGYAAGATNGLDTGIDSKYLATNNASLFSVINGGKYALQGRALPFVTTDVVPMGYKAVTAGSHTLTLDHVDGLFLTTGQAIYIKDNVANTVHNLLDGAYTFTTGTGTFLERFEIVYANEALGTDSPVLNADSIVVYKEGSALKVNAGTADLSEISVFDTRGRLLASQKVNGAEATITNITAQQQVLIVQVKTAQNGTVSKKIIF